MGIQTFRALRGFLLGVNDHKRALLPPQPTIQQTADYFGVDTKTVRRWIAQGRLIAYRVGPRLIRIDRDSVLILASVCLIAASMRSVRSSILRTRAFLAP
jgi:excisionase family DNA binding protein